MVLESKRTAWENYPSDLVRRVEKQAVLEETRPAPEVSECRKEGALFVSSAQWRVQKNCKRRELKMEDWGD